MPSPVNSRPAARLALALSTSAMLSACASSGARDATPSPRSLPPAAAIVPDPVARPAVRSGDDARLLARRALDAADANASRLRQARAAYQGVVDAYGATGSD